MHRSDAAKALDLQAQFLGKIIHKVGETIRKAGVFLKGAARAVARMFGR
jgi:hypothetical protein